MALTEKQILILWLLLAKPGGAARLSSIKPVVKPPDREALVSSGLVAKEKVGRSFRLEVTEKGWGWAESQLAAGAPPTKRPSLGARVFYEWLTAIKATLDAEGATLAEFLAAKPKASAKTAPRATSAENVSSGAPDIEALIRAAYLVCSGGAFNQRVFLSKLREGLPDVDRPALDATLAALHTSGKAQLSGTDNPFELTAADRASSLEFKGETKYVLWIVA